MRSMDRKVLALFAVTILALATVAPFAEAGNAYGHRKYKKNRGHRTVTRVVRYDNYPSRSYYVRRSSSAGPAIAGFIGGLIVGAVLSDRASGHVVYRDPYCDRSFHSRVAFDDHCHAVHRTREVRVVRYTNSTEYYDDCDNRGYYSGGYERPRDYDRDYRDDDYRDRDWDRENRYYDN